MSEDDHCPAEPAGDSAEASVSYSAGKMLKELESPTASWREAHGRIQGAFVRAIDPLISLLLRSGGSAEGEAHFVIRQATARAINDVVVAVHLAFHGYLNQAYNCLRMTIESMELRHLVAAEAGAASEWVSSDQPHRDFAPGTVRRRLERPAYNELHGLFSERAPPRFEAAKLTGFMARKEGSDVPVAILRIGPFLLDEHPAVMEVLLYAFDVTGQLTTESAALVEIAPDLSIRDLLVAIRSCAGAIVEGGELIESRLRLMGGSGADPVIQRHRRILAEVDAVL